MSSERILRSRRPSFRVEHTLAPLNHLFLLSELFLLKLCLLPVFVGNFGEDPPVSFSPFVFIFFEFLLVLINFLVNDFFSLFDQGSLKPFFEFHVRYFLFLLLFKPLFLILLVVNKLLVLDVHAFLVVPFEHLVGPLLHSKGFLFLLEN